MIELSAEEIEFNRVGAGPCRVIDMGAPLTPQEKAQRAWVRAQQEYWMNQLENEIRLGEAELKLMDIILPPLEPINP